MAKSRTSRGLKPRQRRDYDRESFVRGESLMFKNDFTLNTKVARVRIEVPRGKEGLMTCRFWPALNPNNPEKLDRGRIGPHPFRGHSDWLVSVKAASMIGIGKDNKHTFLLYPPDADQETKDNNPVEILTDMCKQAHKAGRFSSGGKWNSAWNQYLIGSDQAGADISRPGNLWFAQGVCYVNGDKDYLEDRELPLGADPGDELLVFRLSSGVGKQIMELFAVEKAEFDGDEDKTPWLKYRYGDPVGAPQKDGSIKGGYYYNFWNPKRFKYNPSGPTSWTGKKKEMQGYEVEILRTLEHGGKTYPSGLTAEEAQTVLEKSQFFFPSSDDAQDGLLYFPPVEEQCLFLARALRKVPKLYLLAMADHPEYVTDEVKAIFAERTQAVSPGLDGEDDYEDEDEDEDEEETPRRKKGRKDPTVTSGKKGKKKPVDDEEEEDEFEDEGDDEEPEDDDESEDADEPEDEEEGDEEEPEDDEESEDDDEESEDEEEVSEEDADDYFDAGDEEEGDEEEGDDEEDEASAEEDEASAEFDPEEESDAKKKEATKKMNQALAKAKGRSSKRSSPAPESAPAPAGKKTAGKKTAGKPAAAKPAKKAAKGAK